MSGWDKSLQWEVMTAREWQHAFYVRDRWQVSDKLTLTLGLRYEYFPLMTREDREMEVIDWRTVNAGGPMVLLLENDIKPSKMMFAPRVGFAYRISDKDVLRAGYGMTNNPLPFSRPLRGFYPLTYAGSGYSNTSLCTLRNPVRNRYPLLRRTGPGFEGSVIIPGNAAQRSMPQDEIHRGYIQSWNVIYERKFPADFVVSFGYVGTQTVRALADLEQKLVQTWYRKQWQTVQHGCLRLSVQLVQTSGMDSLVPTTTHCRSRSTAVLSMACLLKVPTPIPRLSTELMMTVGPA